MAKGPAMSLAAWLLAALACSAAPNGLRPGELVDATGGPVAWEALLELAHDASIILVGESHTSACDHRVQRRVIDSLAGECLAPAVGMEMIPVDQALVLKAFNEGRIEPSAMGRALAWKENWGFPFPLYRPLFEAARRHELPVVALNVPQMAAFLVSRHNVAPEDLHPPQVSAVPTIPPSPLQLEELRQEYKAHQRHLGKFPDLEHFVLVQSMWDTKMAMEAVRAARTLGRPVVVIAGAGHVESLGIPYRLQVLAPDLPVLTLQPWRGGKKKPGDDAHLHYYCP